MAAGGMGDGGSVLVLGGTGPGGALAAGGSGNGGRVGDGGFVGRGGETGQGGFPASGGSGPGGQPGEGGQQAGPGGVVELGGAGPAGAPGVGGVEPIAGAAPLGGSAGQSEPRGLTIYYIRHAEVLANILPVEEITYESSNVFTDLGLRQVDVLAAYLASSGIVPDEILTSPTWRTQKTIEPYLVQSGKTAVLWPELDECCSEEPTGAALPTEPVYFFDAALEAQNVVYRDEESTQFWRNETFEAGYFMVMTARDLFLSRYSQSGKTLMIAGHAVSGTMLLGLLRGYDMSQGVDSSDYTNPSLIYMMNTGIQRVTQDPVTSEFTLEESNINEPPLE